MQNTEIHSNITSEETQVLENSVSDSSSEVVKENQRAAYERPAMEAAENVGYLAAKPELIAEAKSKTIIAEQIDMTAILARYQKETGLSADIVKDHHRELVRFLSLCGITSKLNKSYGMAGAIDELWHTFVIFTIDYANFCEKVAGRFLHHVPEVEGAISSNTLEQYRAFLADYETVYDAPAPAAYWPNPNKIKADKACNGCAACKGCTGTSCTVH